MLRWFRSLQFIFKPKYWWRMHEYSEHLDRSIRWAIKNNYVLGDSYSPYTVDVRLPSGRIISLWIENYPYGSCSYEGYGTSRLTQQEFFDKLSSIRHA